MNRMISTCACLIALVATSCDSRPRADRHLYEALRMGDTNRLRQYLAQGGDVNKPVQFGPYRPEKAPMLSLAVKWGQVSTVDFLLRSGARINFHGGGTNAPLIWAISESETGVNADARLKILQMLLSAGADPNIREKAQYGNTPLLWAAMLGESNMVRVLLASGAKANDTNDGGQSALHLAKNAEVAKLLLSAGANRDLQTKMGRTPVDTALDDRRFDVLSILTNTPADK